MSEAEVVHGDLPEVALARYLTVPVVALDIETSSLDWKTGRIGTCQISARGATTTIVVSPAGPPMNLSRLLECGTVQKVFHHAPFDLRFIVHAWHVKPVSILCTKVASKVLHPEADNSVHSLKALLWQYLGVELDKSEQTSDWLGNLSPGQLRYAAEDVRYLIPLVELLTAELHERGLLNLYRSCCAFLPTHVELAVRMVPDVFAH